MRKNTDAFHGSVSGFLRYIDWLLENNDDFQQSSVSAGAENAVAVKTMHGSKGLEYPFVFLGNLEKVMKYRDGEKSALFSERGLAGFCVKDPTTYVRAKTVPFAVLCQEGENAYKSEELRLLYVAMTRAKQQLFLPLEWQKILSGEKRLSDQVQCNDLAGGETACLSGTVSKQHGTVDLDVSVPAV